MTENNTENNKVANSPSQSGNNSNSTDYFKFGKDIVWMTAAQVFVSIVLGILMLPALTKHYSTDLYDEWVLVSLVVGLMAPLVSLQLGLAAVRFMAGEDDPQKRRRFVGAMLSANVVFAGIVLLAGIPLSGWISNLVFKGRVEYYWLSLVWIYFNSIYNLFLAYLQARRLNKTISIVQIVTTTVEVSVILVMAISHSSMVLLIISQIVLQVLFCVVLLVVVTRETGFPIPGFAGLKKFLSFSLPQIPSFILLWIIMYSDRLLINYFIGRRGTSEVGVYTNSMTLAGLTALFYAPVSFVLFSLLSKFWAQKRLDEMKSYFEYSQKFFLGIAIPGAVGIAMLSQQLLKILTTSEYLAGRWLVFLLTIGLVIYGVYQMNTNLILLGKRSRWLPWVVAAGAVISVSLNVLLIPRLGIIGAAYGGCAAYLVLSVVSTIWARNVVPYKLDVIFYLKVIAASVLMWLGLNLLKIDGILGMGEAVIFGIIIYAAAIIALRAFSARDYRVVRQIVTDFMHNRRKPSS